MYHPLQHQHFQPPPQYKYPPQQIANGVQYVAQNSLHPAPSPAPQPASAPFANVIIESTNKIEKNIGGQLWTCYYDNSTNNRKQKYVITTNIPKYCFSKASLYITYDDEKDLKQETFMFSISSFVFTQKISKVTAEGAEYVFVAEHDNTATFKRKSGKGNTCSIYVVFDTNPQSTVLLGAFGLLLFSKESVAENFLKKKQIEITNQQRKLQMNSMMQPQQTPQNQVYAQQQLIQPSMQHPQPATKIQIVQQMQPQQVLHYHSPQQFSPQHPISPLQHPVNPENPSPVMSPISQPQQPTQPQSPPHQYHSGYPSPQQTPQQPPLHLSAQSQMQPSQVSATSALQSQLLQQQAAQQLAALLQSQNSLLTSQALSKPSSSAPNPISKSTKQRKKYKKLHTTKMAPTVATVTDEFTDFLADMQGMDLLTHFESFVNNYNYAVDTAINIGTWAQPSELLSTKGSSTARPSHVTEADQERISSFLSRFYADEFSSEEHNLVIQEGDQLVFNLSNIEKNGNSIVIVGVDVTYSILRYTNDGEEELVTYENQVHIKGDLQKPASVDSNISILPVGHTAKMSIPVDSNILEAAKSVLDSDDPQEELAAEKQQEISYSPVAVMSVCFNFVKYQESKAVKKVVDYIVEPIV